MTDYSISNRDPAFATMTMDILRNVLSHADNPSELGQYLIGKVRELTGARCVILIEFLSAQAPDSHRVVSVSPASNAQWAKSPAMDRFCNALRDLPAHHTWRGNDGTEPAAFLRDQGFDLSLAIPLSVGSLRAGTMLVLGLADEGRLESDIPLLNTFSTLVALVLRNAFLYEKQEQIIHERTEELQVSNAASQRSQTRLNLALECSGVGTWDWDLASDTHTGDQYASILFGRRAEPFTGKTGDFLALVHPDDREHVQAAMKSAIGGLTGYESEYRVIWPDGSVHYLAARGRAYRDPSGNTLRMGGVCWDITRRRQSDEALKEASQFNQQVINSARDGIIVYDRQLRFQVWNSFMESLTGMAASEVLGRDTLEVFPFLSQTPLMEAVKRGLRGERTEALEFPYHIPQTGRSGWVSDAVSTLYNARGEIIGAISTVRDITAEKQAKEAVRVSNERTTGILSSISDAFFSMNDQMVVTYFNDAAERTLNRKRDDVIGRNLFDAFPEARGSIFETQYTQAIREKKTLSFETYFDREPYRNWYDVRVYPQPDGISVYFQVITARKESEELLQRELIDRRRIEEAERQARARAEEANRAKDQFIAVLSHELRTPLTPVLAQVELLQARRDLPPDVLASMEMVHRNVELESTLIADLLDITQVVRGNLRLEQTPTDAHESIREALSICQPQIAAKGHHVELDLQADKHMLLADPVRLRQIFWNLLGNSVKYTHEAGRICLRSCNTPDGRLQVQVIDDGIGIAPELIERLFEPFVQGEQTLSRRFGGLGLGLSISKALVHAHHGTLSASSPGQGSGATFTVEFPVLAEQAAGPKTPSPAPRAESRPARIFVVEDNEDTLRVLAKLLRSSRHEVKTATTVKAALELAAEWEFDVLLCDIGLPDGTGWDLMRQFPPNRRSFKALALSGFAADDDIQKSRDAGFIDHLAKPINIEQLRRSIRMALD